MANRPQTNATLAGIGGTRIEWSGVPEAVRQSVDDRLGAAVSEAVSQALGFSPGLAARLRLSDGRRVFVKAIGPDDESGAPRGRDFYRREARITAGLPDNASIGCFTTLNYAERMGYLARNPSGPVENRATTGRSGPSTRRSRCSSSSVHT
jgi:hypothetical protein